MASLQVRVEDYEYQIARLSKNGCVIENTNYNGEEIFKVDCRLEKDEITNTHRKVYTLIFVNAYFDRNKQEVKNRYDFIEIKFHYQARIGSYVYNYKECNSMPSKKMTLKALCDLVESISSTRIELGSVTLGSSRVWFISKYLEATLANKQTVKYQVKVDGHYKDLFLEGDEEVMVEVDFTQDHTDEEILEIIQSMQIDEGSDDAIF